MGNFEVVFVGLFLGIIGGGMVGWAGGCRRPKVFGKGFWALGHICKF